MTGDPGFCMNLDRFGRIYLTAALVHNRMETLDVRDWMMRNRPDPAKESGQAEIVRLKPDHSCKER